MRNNLEGEAEHEIEDLKDINAEKLDKIRIQMDISDGTMRKVSLEETEEGLARKRYLGTRRAEG